MSLINIETPEVQKSKMNRNFEGPKLSVHKIQYTLMPDGLQKTAHIIAEDFLTAERVLVSAFPPGQKFHINSYSDSEREICAFSPSIKKELYLVWKEDYDPLTSKNIKKRLK